jgi:hypothetical protein
MAKRKRPKHDWVYTGVLAEPIKYCGLEELQLKQISQLATVMNALFRDFEIDQGAPELDRWRLLALGLASRHVPALQSERIFEKYTGIGRSGAPVALDVRQTINFLRLWISKIEAARQRGEKPRDDPIATEMAKHPMFEGLGNRMRGSNKGPLSGATLKKCMREVRTFGAAAQSGKLTEFQRQLTDKVIPNAQKMIQHEQTSEEWRQHLAVVLNFLRQFEVVAS